MITSTVDVPADPLAVARALEGCPALSLVRAADGSATYVAADPVDTSDELDPEPHLVLEQREHGEIPRWIGLLPYEAQRSLERGAIPDRRPPPDISRPRWLRYDSIIKITNKVEILSSTSRALEELRQVLERGLRRAQHPQPVAITLTSAEPGRVHVERIRAALELIAKGDIYQVNLARRFALRVEGQAAPLLALLCPSGLTRCAAALQWPELVVAAATPELFLMLNPDRSVFTSPIKGTRPRAADVTEDTALARSLDADPKERAELAMVIDVERNDLGRLAKPGTVALAVAPHVETLETVHHRLATVRAELRPEIGRRALLEATLPSGSVTGAPKVRAMEIIADLEAARRGLYTGALGFVRRDGGLELGMAIRTLTVAGGEGSYFAGGGIVADSDPGREVEETLWKARRLIEASGGRFENWA